MTTNQKANKTYLDKANRPTALKANIEEQLNDIDLSAFANQLLTARSWYKGRKAKQAEEIFDQMIKNNLEGAIETIEIIELGARRLNLIY